MKSITICGNKMIVLGDQYTINEGLPDFWKSLFGGKNKKNGFLGTVLSLIPGIGEKMEGKEKADAYTEAQTKWFETWKKRREDELKKDQDHLMNMKVTNYEILQQKKLNKHDAERKVKEFKQKQELAARKAVLAQLKREGNKIAAWTGLGPSTPEFMGQIIQVSERLYEDATPAEQKIKDNILGVLVEINRDEQGNYISNPELVAERMDELYGEKDSDGRPIKGSGKNNPMFDSPEFRSAYETFVTNRPKDESEFTNRMVKAIVNNPDFRTNEELDEDKRVVEDRIAQMKEDEDRIKKLEDEKNKIEANLKKIEEKEKAAKEAKEIKDNWKDATPKQIREKLTNEIADAMANASKDEKSDSLFIQNTSVGDDGKSQTTIKLNPKSPLYKNLTALGLTQEDIDSWQGMDKKVISKHLENITDESLTKYRDDVVKAQDVKIQAGDDAEEAREENNKRLKEITSTDKDENGNPIGELVQAEATKKAHDDSPEAKQAIQITRRYNPSIQNDGTPITKDAMMKASAAVEHHKEENSMALKEISNISAKAKKYREEHANDTAYDKAYDKLSDEEKQKIDTITAKPVDAIKHDGDREYIEVDGEEDDPDNPGEKRKKRLYKPDKDDPDYDDKLQAWDTAVSAKFATMPVGEKPVAKHNPPDFEDIKAMREWEANKKAKEAAKQDFIEKNKDKYKDPADALDALSDKEWLRDQNADELADDDDVENSDGEDVVDKKDQEQIDKEKQREDRIKELEDKKNNGEELSKEEQEELDKLKQEIEDEDNAKDDTEKRNPARIWKKRKNKSTGKSTKRYYYCGKNAKRKASGESISKKEYQEKLKKYKEAKAAEGKEPKKSKEKEATTGGTESTTDNNSITNPQRPIQFKKSPWTMTRLCESKK